MSRIYDEKVPIDESQVRDFFERRGSTVSPDHPLTSVLYQDEHPEIAAYVARGEARPAFQRAFDAQLAVFAAASRSQDGLA